MTYRTKLFIAVGGAVIILGAAVYSSFQRQDSISYSNREEGELAVQEGQSSLEGRQPNTEDLSKDVLTTYLRSKEVVENEPLDEESRELLAGDITKTFAREYENSLPEYSASDFELGASGSADIEAYGNELGQLLRDNTPDQLPDVARTIEAAVNNNDPEELEDLDVAITSYGDLTEDYKAMTVPRDAGELHAELVTRLEHHLINLKALRDSFSDSARALMGLRNYEKGVTAMVESFQSLAEYFDERDISFQQGDGGSAIMNTLQ